MKSRKMLTNASYFAFTATPKNKTLEMFGEPLPPDAEGKVKHRPFHSYTMKQAIQEGFILDVLKNYTPVDSYYKLVKTVEGDPEFDTKRAQKKLRQYVESHDHAIRLKAEIMVDHFHEQVLALNKIGGQARAMVVTSGIERAIQYFHAIRDVPEGAQEPVPGHRRVLRRARVRGREGHRSVAERLPERRHRGQDSGGPVPLPDLRRQVPDRLRRAAAAHDVRGQAALRHQGGADALAAEPGPPAEARRVRPRLHERRRRRSRQAFADYYRTTILSEETDPNKLHDLKAALDGHQVYRPSRSTAWSRCTSTAPTATSSTRSSTPAWRPTRRQLDEDGQVDFKGKAKAFTRTYDFLASILPYTNAAWEKLSIFLNFLVPKLPAPKEEDLSKGILEAIDMDSYRVERRPPKVLCPTRTPRSSRCRSGRRAKGGAGAGRPSNILKTFNDQFGTLFTDADRVVRRIKETSPRKSRPTSRTRTPKRTRRTRPGSNWTPR